VALRTPEVHAPVGFGFGRWDRKLPLRFIVPGGYIAGKTQNPLKKVAEKTE
jgi:hypothetical protein